MPWHCLDWRPLLYCFNISYLKQQQIQISFSVDLYPIFLYTFKGSIESNKDNHENDIGTENHQGQETKSLLRTAFVVASLSFHSAITGLTLGLEEEASGVWINLAAIASHKFVIAFSVGVEMVSSKVCNVPLIYRYFFAKNSCSI